MIKIEKYVMLLDGTSNYLLLLRLNVDTCFLSKLRKLVKVFTIIKDFGWTNALVCKCLRRDTYKPHIQARNMNENLV